MGEIGFDDTIDGGMMSSLTWIDNSEKERQKALEFVDTFREKETRDELGIGVIRDAFSETLFPGTTTVQTRARYFLLIPWVYQRTAEYAAKGRSFAQVKEQAELLEKSLMRALKSGGDEAGLFGRVAGENISRLASDVYWNGLGYWGMRRYEASRIQLIRELAASGGAQKLKEMSDEDRPITTRSDVYWHPGLPKAPADLFDSTTFALSEEESKYLRDMLLENAGRSLLAHLVSSQSEMVNCDAPWTHPGAKDLPEHNKRELTHAKHFSLVMNGAALLYNLMLAEKRIALGWPDPHDTVDKYDARVAQWIGLMDAASDELQQWDVNDFWALVEGAGARVSSRTRGFVGKWLSTALADTAGAVRDETIRALIRRREMELKGGLARLESNHALGLWNEASGVEPLNYRWGTVQVIVNDIVKGTVRA